MEDSALLAGALKTWEDISLSKLQRELDAQGLEIVENQKESLASRKNLAEQTKEFKKVSDEEKLNQFKVLLKNYQNEIDNITKRCKTAENHFLNVYKLLMDAPDPTPLISAVISQSKQLSTMETVQLENTKLRQDLSEAHAEVASLKSQAEKSSQLQSTLNKYQSKMEELINEKIMEKEAELNAAAEERIKIYKEREQTLERQSQQLQAQVMQLQTTNEISQSKLLQESQKANEETGAKLAELEMVLQDLDSANFKINQLEKEKEALKFELTQLKTSDEEEQRSRSSVEIMTLEKRCALQEAEINKLLSELDTSRSQVTALSVNLKTIESSLVVERKAKADEMGMLKRKLEMFGDYEMVKKELDMMKLIEFSKAEGAVDPSLVREQPVEVLLANKNKRLQSDLTDTKMELEESSGKLLKAEQTVTSLEEKVQKQTALIKKLEEDMLKLNAIAGSGGYTKEDSSSQLDPLSNLLRPNHLQPSTSISNMTTSQSQPTDSTTIIPILTSQRDRFRQRNAELEEQLRQQTSTLNSLQSEIETLKNDNVKLYEKFRYVQSMTAETSPTAISNYPPSYRNSIPSASPLTASGGNVYSLNGSSSSSNSNHSRHQGVRGPSQSQPPEYVSVAFEENKYRTMYEEKLDPFMRFHRREETRRYQNLNPAERAALSLTRLFLNNKYSRYIFIIYSILLHLLVMMTLYRVASYECRHDHEGLKEMDPGPSLGNERGHT